MTIYINKDSEELAWVKKNEEFEGNTSFGVRRCIQVSMRAYEYGDDKDIAKFIHGK